MQNEQKYGSVLSPIQPPRDFTAERDAEVIPVVRKLLHVIGSKTDLPIGARKGATSAEVEAVARYYEKLYQEEVVPIFLEANIKLNAIPYVFSLILTPFQLLNDVTTSSFEMNRDLADAKKYGITDINDLRVNDLDKALKAEVVDKPVDQS